MKIFLVLFLILFFPINGRADDICTPYGYELLSQDIGAIDSVTAGRCIGSILISTPFAFILTDDTYCSAGYYFNGTSCVAYQSGDGCPTTYYTSSSFVRANTNGTCASSFVFGSDMPICGVKIGDTSASICTPQLICATGATTLRSSTGMILPIWRDKLTTPSLNFKFENGDICYLNMLPGMGSNTVNIKDNNNNIYHGVE